jgi:Flp pilus assembly secretin CpaC
MKDVGLMKIILRSIRLYFPIHLASIAVIVVGTAAAQDATSDAGQQTVIVNNTPQSTVPQSESFPVVEWFAPGIGPGPSFWELSPGSYDAELLVGDVAFMNLPFDMATVVVGDDTVATADPQNSRQLVYVARGKGTTSVLITDASGEFRVALRLRVNIDVAGVDVDQMLPPGKKLPPLPPKVMVCRSGVCGFEHALR